ncbi:MAG: L,D-transpeptidase [Dinoroseobacter sp.]|nr:L,D-transpeptidase [Dinoroseobacter sp.]MDJ0993299.1 L,D-transpeptidase [Dinoroseobacter sp.]
MISKRAFLALGAAAVATPKGLLAQRAFQLDPRFEPQVVPLRYPFKAGQIIVLPQAHYLYLVMPGNQAMRYGVGVGKAGLEFKGNAIIQRKAVWPDWRPTDEMIKREPHKYEKYANGVPGGPGNPLGARALYLYQNGIDTYFRIHGTTEPWSIGRSASNGCIRMIDEHVIDLYERVPRGTLVTVL